MVVPTRFRFAFHCDSETEAAGCDGLLLGFTLNHILRGPAALAKAKPDRLGTHLVAPQCYGDRRETGVIRILSEPFHQRLGIVCEESDLRTSRAATNEPRNLGWLEQEASDIQPAISAAAEGKLGKRIQSITPSSRVRFVKFCLCP